MTRKRLAPARAAAARGDTHLPFASSDGTVRIHYETEGSGPPVILHHGYGTNLEQWRRLGYVDRLSDQFELILMDARGHGQSDKPTREEDYDFPTRVADVTAVLDALDHSRAFFCGYSMGAHIGMYSAAYAPDRLTALMLGGASPYGGADLVMSTMSFDEVWPGIVKRQPDADRDALAACFAAQMKFSSAEQILTTTSLPYMLFAGGRDAGPLRGTERFGAEHMAQYFTVPDKDHFGALADVDVVVPRIAAFFAAIGG